MFGVFSVYFRCIFRRARRRWRGWRWRPVATRIWPTTPATRRCTSRAFGVRLWNSDGSDLVGFRPAISRSRDRWRLPKHSSVPTRTRSGSPYPRSRVFENRDHLHAQVVSEIYISSPDIYIYISISPTRRPRAGPAPSSSSSSTRAPTRDTPRERKIDRSKSLRKARSLATTHQIIFQNGKKCLREKKLHQAEVPDALGLTPLPASNHSN